MKARAEGRSFPPYNVVHQRFVRSLLRIAAGEVPVRGLVEEALGVADAKGQA